MVVAYAVLGVLLLYAAQPERPTLDPVPERAAAGEQVVATGDTCAYDDIEPGEPARASRIALYWDGVDRHLTDGVVDPDAFAYRAEFTVPSDAEIGGHKLIVRCLDTDVTDSIGFTVVAAPATSPPPTSAPPTRPVTTDPRTPPTSVPPSPGQTAATPSASPSPAAIPAAGPLVPLWLLLLVLLGALVLAGIALGQLRQTRRGPRWVAAHLAVRPAVAGPTTSVHESGAPDGGREFSLSIEPRTPEPTCEVEDDR